MSTAKQVVKNSIWLLTANIVMKILSAIVIITLARKLGTESFGQYSFAIAFVGFFTLIATFGFDSLLIRDIAKNKEEVYKYVNNILTIKIVFGIIALIILFIVSQFINKPTYLIVAIYIFGIDIIVGGFSDTLRNIFQAYENMRFYAITNIIEKFLWAGLLLLVIFMKTTLLNVALATLTSAFLGLLITYWLAKKNLVKISLETDWIFWKSIIIQALPFALTSLFSLINFKIDQVILSFMQSDIILGWYSAAYKIIDILALIPSLLLTALYPVFSRYHKENEILLKKGFDLALRYVIILAIPVVIGVFLVADKLILLLYGTEYFNSISVLRILIFISLISFINTPLFVMLNAIGKQKITMIYTAIIACVNTIMNILLIPILSIKGSALATIIAEITFLILSSYQLRKSGFELRLFQKIIKPLIAGIIMAVVMLLIIKTSIFIIIPIAAITYFVVLFLIKEFDKEDIELAKRVLSKRNAS